MRARKAAALCLWLGVLSGCSNAPEPKSPPPAEPAASDARATDRPAQETGHQEMTIPAATEEKINALGNDHVSWKGTIAGLMPVIVNPETHSLIADEAPIDAQLVERLLDPEAYVAAHVILSQRAGTSFSSDASQWNGLHVGIAADGSISYQPEDRDALYEMWSERLDPSGRLRAP